MNSNINLYLFVSAFGNHESIDDAVLTALVADSSNPIFDIFLLCPPYSSRLFTFDEQLKYNIDFVKHVFGLYGFEATEPIVELCAVFLMKYFDSSATVCEKCEEVCGVDVEEDDWLWLIREYVKYALMGSYLRAGSNYSRIKELANSMSASNQVFEQKWDAAQLAVNNLINK